jgi:hypothetical protein
MTISMRESFGVSWTSPVHASSRHPQPTTRRRRVTIMKKHILIAGISVLAIGFSASMASAVCDPNHPKKAGQLKSSLVQAFVSCNNPGGNTPNLTTEGGVPACQPPETFHQQAGNPIDGWVWDAAKGKGDVTFKASKNKVANILNPVPNTADLAVSLKMGGVLDSDTLAPANGNGTLATIARATFEDRANGMITVVDFPAGFPISAVDGKISLKTSANVLLNGIGQPGLPGCSTVEVVSVNVVDPNGNSFASMGTFLPDIN